MMRIISLPNPGRLVACLFGLGGLVVRGVWFRCSDGAVLYRLGQAMYFVHLCARKESNMTTVQPNFLDRASNLSDL